MEWINRSDYSNTVRFGRAGAGDILQFFSTNDFSNSIGSIDYFSDSGSSGLAITSTHDIALNAGDNIFLDPGLNNQVSVNGVVDLNTARGRLVLPVGENMYATM